MTFVFPNLWQNNLGANARIIAAFVCVDEEHSILYLRFYRNFGKFPGVRQLIQGDLPFVLYRRRRVQLQKEAEAIKV